MSINKNAVLRYNTLDKCFQNFGRKYYFDDLLNEINQALLEDNPESSGIQIRQLRADISFMKSDSGYSAPIEAYREGKKAYYRYADKDFSINNSPLNSTEAEQLKNAISVLQRFEGSPEFEWVNELAPMLNDQFGLKDESKKVMAFDSNIDYSGYQNITPLFNAIVNKQVLKINYKPYEKEAFELDFHPYFLKQYNHRWFVFGRNELLGVNQWNLALDRIQTIKQSEVKYVEDKTDWEDYFYDVIGVSFPKDAKKEKIELEFTKEQAPYVLTKPLHPSQKNKPQDDGSLKVQLDVIVNYELEMKLLSFANAVKVIAPNHLSKTISNRLKSASKMY